MSIEVRENKCEQTGARAANIRSFPALYTGNQVHAHSFSLGDITDPQRFERIHPRSFNLVPTPEASQIWTSIVSFSLLIYGDASGDFPTTCNDRPVPCIFTPPRDVVMHVLPSISSALCTSSSIQLLSDKQSHVGSSCGVSLLEYSPLFSASAEWCACSIYRCLSTER
ncbi:hypothetical protein N431DRAFT_92999 [Stipitochalara longipes BDJ]|nr:hypothetical protein N431DRAFT_92999 [Stipitochalara longipes BDJ]